MRFLGVGDSNDLGDMYIRLGAAGHDVKVHVADSLNHGKLDGLVTRVPDWEPQLAWVRAAGSDGFVLFETAHAGEVQDLLRRDGFNVIGGSSLGDRLENDRAFGQQRMRESGLLTAPMHEFQDFDAADRFLQRNPARYVFKRNGSHVEAHEAYVSELEDGSDLRVMLRRERQRARSNEPPDFVLMTHLEGVEVGVGAYFNGQRFMDAICIDWEHKRFFNGDMGEMTGEMGTLVSYRNAGPLFAATLGKMADMLRESGYVGYINLNTIVNDKGIWPLEFTARFGYPGFAILDCLHREGWDQLFSRMAGRSRTDFQTLAGYAVGAVLTVPPFPFAIDSRAAAGLPIKLRGDLSAEDRRNLHFDEVQLSAGDLQTSGPTGYVMVVTGRGLTVEEAQTSAYSLMRRVVVPNGRYRTDIGARFLSNDRAALRKWNLWPATEDALPDR